MSRPRPTVDLGYPTPAYGRIPAFTTIDEEAAFWDTHDAAAFMGQELQLIEAIPDSPDSPDTDLAERLTVRLDKADRDMLATRAKAKGIGPSTLARIWLKERLLEEADSVAR